MKTGYMEYDTTSLGVKHRKDVDVPLLLFYFP